MQPCSQPWYGLIDCVNGMSGESLRLMIVRAGWIRTTVFSGGSASSSPPASSIGSPAVVDRLALLAPKAVRRIERRAATLRRRGRSAHRTSLSRQDASTASIVTVIDGDSARETTQLTLAFDAISANCWADDAGHLRARHEMDRL